MNERTKKNINEAFVGEAKAYQRLLMYAKKAESEDLPQIARLFRAVAESEGIHARRHFALLEKVSDTQTNLENAFQSENLVNGIYYPRMLKEAEEDGEKGAAIVFSQARDVESVHAKLYENALKHMMEEREVEYYVCPVCGYLREGAPDENCPVCNAPKEKFYKVE
ncbi:MAG: rubrerythrin family protein [Deltaproteobacteria bacterium]|nr:rubrerythrin family protein [Deltaproteobacteria bacterium]